MVSGDAILASSTAVGLALVAGCWRLAFLLGRIQTKVDAELSHNGGGSLKDTARDAKVAATQARDLIANAQDDLRLHVSNSDLTHAAMWAAMTQKEHT